MRQKINVVADSIRDCRMDEWLYSKTTCWHVSGTVWIYRIPLFTQNHFLALLKDRDFPPDSACKVGLGSDPVCSAHGSWSRVEHSSSMGRQVLRERTMDTVLFSIQPSGHSSTRLGKRRAEVTLLNTFRGRSFYSMDERGSM